MIVVGNDKKVTISEREAWITGIGMFIIGFALCFAMFYISIGDNVCGEVAMDSSDFEEIFYRAYSCEYDKITFEYILKILDDSLNLSQIIQSGELNSSKNVKMIMEMKDKHVELNKEFNFFEEPLGRIRSDYYVESDSDEK